MANEIGIPYGISGDTLYAILRDSTDRPYNTNTLAFEVYTSANYAKYAIPLTEQGTSGFYAGNFPTVGAGVYGIEIRVQAGSNPVESPATDILAGAGEEKWNGSALTPPTLTAGPGLGWVGIDQPAAPNVAFEGEPSIIYRYTDWVRTYWFDFINFSEIQAGNTISVSSGISPIITPLTGDGQLTITNVTVNGTKVFLTISGGTSGQRYTLACKIVTSNNVTLSFRGISAAL